MRFLITMVISFAVELKCNEWMTVFTLCDSDLREAGLGSSPLRLPLKLKKLSRRNLKTREAAAHLTHFQLGDELSPEAQ